MILSPVLFVILVSYLVFGVIGWRLIIWFKKEQSLFF
jgi:hypothetical protein